MNYNGPVITVRPAIKDLATIHAYLKRTNTVASMSQLINTGIRLLANTLVENGMSKPFTTEEAYHELLPILPKSQKAMKQLAAALRMGMNEASAPTTLNVQISTDPDDIQERLKKAGLV